MKTIRSPLYPDVPLSHCIALSPENREQLLADLRQIHAQRIWIALSREEIFSNDRSLYLDEVRDNLDFYHKNGFEVGLWFTAFGMGNPPESEFLGKRLKSMTRICSVTGKASDVDAICPTDEDFSATYMDWIRDLAGLGAELLMLDDDLCLSVRPGIGCFCPMHMRQLSERLGEKVTLDSIRDKIFTGGKNRYRDAWYKVMGDTMRDFCHKVRAAADEVNPSIRIGFAAGYTAWDMEGADAIELTRILAGNTKPFLRLTSAPYWVTPYRNRFPGQKLNSVIESARLQRSWLDNSQIEFFAEGDSWPRPRHNCPASYLQLFDDALQADGVRLLKYAFDYTSSAKYERGYLQQHFRNIPLQEAIRTAFHDKHSDGVCLFRNSDIICNEPLPQQFVGEKNIMRLFFSQSAAMLSAQSIPLCYEGSSPCAVAFGTEALAIPENHSCSHIILDFEAARLLSERGIDVGFDSFSSAPIPNFELFGSEKVHLFGIGVGAPHSTVDGFYQVHCKSDVKVLSQFTREKNSWPSAYTYKSGNVTYLVFTFDALAVGESSTLYTSYCRQTQLLSFIQPVFPYIAGHPGIYSICASSENRDSQAVLFENLSCDTAFDFHIKLSRPCSNFTLFGAEGTLDEDRMSIHITSDFVPFSALLLELSYEGK